MKNDFPFFGMAISGPLDAQYITHHSPSYRAHVPRPIVMPKYVTAFSVEDLEIFEYRYSELYLGSKDVRHGYWIPKGSDLKWVREELDRAYQFRATSRGRRELYATLRREVLEEAAKVAERYVIDENELHPDVPFKEINQQYKNAVHAGAQYIAAAIRALGEKP